ncbi:hypothetical protein PV755_09170 [Streptomyces caniscabiei]|uniref:Uncharacterized protein n=1 Tax=Streptomyces caniscabiei TaxID=2746961 RepID=A0A927KXH0_9ACTN|nr:hypothetical protein [Streptomyces caniscabiei]MBD9721900.1 hypothetical protein [Streptomyces caniscabiei]MDX3509091.1 hypothetical protein [Streptomyces caniscabiei]MDX3717156.1 hypothetical protein [Streptomyces caniscabiei]WEO23023.1 hypothetical protein IHE65_07555 [Streptomyces caniscabiei]
MSDYPEIAAHFESDFAAATLTVQREDGLFRHIQFEAPKSMNRLVLVTWPYNLLVAGSHGSYHFERFGPDTEDMFCWLRRLRVDADSWSSKLVNGHRSVREYDRDRLEAQINERVEEAVRDGWAPEGLKAAVDEEILDSHLLDNEGTALQLVSEFQHGVAYRSECSCGKGEDHDDYSSAVCWNSLTHKGNGDAHKVKIRRTAGFDFDDFAEWDVHKLSYHFVYQCHAAVWGIAQYDAARKAVAVDA